MPIRRPHAMPCHAMPCHALRASSYAAHLPEAADDGARAVLAAVAMDEKRVVPRVEDVC